MLRETPHNRRRPKKAQTPFSLPTALAGISTTITPEAEAFVLTSPVLSALVEQIAQILRETIEDGAPFTSVVLEVVTDPEDPECVEFVFSIGVQADFDETMRWWRKIGAGQAELNTRLPERERTILAHNVGVHLFPEIGGDGVRPN